jgi:hypothetical protein
MLGCITGTTKSIFVSMMITPSTVKCVLKKRETLRGNKIPTRTLTLVVSHLNKDTVLKMIQSLGLKSSWELVDWWAVIPLEPPF